MDIAAWLRELELERYADAFVKNDVDGHVLRRLTADDLRDIGVASVGHRRRLLDAIAALGHPSPSGGAADLSDAVPAAAKVSPIDAERRQLTVMFCDLVGSTELSTRLDPEDLRAVVAMYQRACGAVAAGFEGHVAQYLGDGIMIFFGWPKAHEDDAERAVRTGLAIRDAVAALEPQPEVALEVRIGIATGLVVVGDLVDESGVHDGAVSGETPNLAARLQGLAEPGQVVIGNATQQLVAGCFEVDNLGHHPVKGLPEAGEGCAGMKERPRTSRFEVRAGPTPPPMMGRDRELALLLDRWARAEAGEGQGVLLVGEAGIGKSRLVRALVDAVAEKHHISLQYHCSPHHRDSALRPVIEQLTRAAGNVAANTTDAKLDAVETLLARSGCSAAAPLIAELLGLDGSARYGALDLSPEMRRTRTLAALIDHILGLAANHPVLLVLEDAHWVDPTTLDLVDQILGLIAEAPVLVVATSRPERQPSLGGHAHVGRLGLDRLDRRAIEEIVTRLWGQVPPRDVMQAIVARTDGVPLFVEELTKAVMEGGEATIPASLHDSLMARLDRLASVREIAQVGAVIGREFGHHLLTTVADQPLPELTAALEQLVSSELVFRRGTPPEATYSFKHALVQDAAYQSLLRSRRRHLHARIAEALQRDGPEPGGGAAETIAHHLTEAGESERAIGWWGRAGDQARDQFANPEARVHYLRALDLLGALPPSRERDRKELELRLGLGAPLFIVEGYTSARVRRNGLRTVELCRALEDDRNLFRALYDLQRNAFQSDEFQQASVYANELVGLGERTGDNPAEICGVFGLASIHLIRGELGVAAKLFERGDALDDALQHRDLPTQHFQPGIGCKAFGAMNSWMLGHPEQALRRMSAAMEAACRIGTPFIVGFALHRLAVMHHYVRDPGAALTTAARFLQLAEEHPMAHWVPWLWFIRAWAQAAMGARDVALADLGKAWPLWHARGSETYGPYFRCIAAEVHLASGEVQAGLETLSDALDVSRRTGERHWLPEVHRVKGLLMLAAQSACLGEAADCFEAALGEARRQQARSLELRAATSLARLWADGGERRKAHDLLAPVYAWFAEGFETTDLNDAKQLLGELA